MSSKTDPLCGRRSFLCVAAGSLALIGEARAGAPAGLDRPLARRLELWAKAVAGTVVLVARYALTRQSTLLKEPLVAAGTMLVRAPDTLLLRDDDAAGATTRLARGQLEIRPNDRSLPALAEASNPAVTWLFEQLLALFSDPGDDPIAGLLGGARVSLARGPGQRLALAPPREHPARRQIRDLIVQLDPHTGDVDHLDLLEAGGDRVSLGFSQRRRDAPDSEIAALLQQA